MSFRTIVRSSAALRAPMQQQQQRAFASSALRQKSVIDSVKETADAVNKKVGETLASGIGAAQETAESAQKTVEQKTPTSDELSTKAEGAKQEVNHKLGQAAGKARDAKDELEKKI